MQQNPDLADIMRIAQSSSGQKLIAFLQKQGGNSLQAALSKASAGDYNAVKENLSNLMASDEIKRLLNDLEGKL